MHLPQGAKNHGTWFQVKNIDVIRSEESRFQTLHIVRPSVDIREQNLIERKILIISDFIWGIWILYQIF